MDNSSTSRKVSIFKMSEDTRTLWVGNLHKDVTDELVYELFLQTGPIEKLVFPTEGDGDNKKHRGHAYVLFKHMESVIFASQVLEGTKLFGNVLEMKARSMPITYRSSPAPGAHNNMGNKFHGNSRFSDNTSLRGGFNRTNTWHGREDFVPRGRGSGGYNRHNKGQTGFNNQQQNTNTGYNSQGQGSFNFNNQMNTGGYWMSNQQQQIAGTNSTGQAAYSTDMEAKRQRILQQQNLVIQGSQQQQQQSMMNMYQQQQNWSGTEGYTTANYSTTGGTNWNTTNNSNMYQSYGNQYNNWYQQQQQQ